MGERGEPYVEMQHRGLLTCCVSEIKHADLQILWCDCEVTSWLLVVTLALRSAGLLARGFVGRMAGFSDMTGRLLLGLAPFHVLFGLVTELVVERGLVASSSTCAFLSSFRSVACFVSCFSLTDLDHAPSSSAWPSPPSPHPGPSVSWRERPCRLVLGLRLLVLHHHVVLLRVLLRSRSDLGPFGLAGGLHWLSTFRTQGATTRQNPTISTGVVAKKTLLRGRPFVKT